MYKIINEVLRKELIKGSKLQSPDRLARSKKYSAKDFKNVNFRQLMEHDTFTWIARVGDHTVAISFEGPFEDLKFYVKGMRGPNRLKRINVKLVAAALSKSLDENDLYISCTCLHPETKIKLLNGETVEVSKLAKKFDSGESIYVYSVDKNGDFKPGKVEKVWQTGIASKFVEITLDNDEKILTTPEHLYMMRDGSYKMASDLVLNDSLMPLYFGDIKGYETVKFNSSSRYHSVYKEVAKYFKQDELNLKQIESEQQGKKPFGAAIHHSDFNKKNNYPENLQIMTARDHWEYHSNMLLYRWQNDEDWIRMQKEKARNHIIELNANPTEGLIESRKKWREAGIAHNYDPAWKPIQSEIMRKVATEYWDSMTEEEYAAKCKSISDLQNTPEVKLKHSESMKANWRNLSTEDRKKRKTIASNNLNGINGEKASKRIKNYWKNVTEEDIYNINLTKISRVIDKILLAGELVTEENYNKYRTNGYPKFNKCFDKFDDLIKYFKLNHRVKNIEYIDLEEPIPVYDIKVYEFENFLVNAGVILHNCPDFRYRFAYYCSQEDCKFGKQENRPPKYKQTNMDNSKGLLCKHLLSVLIGKRWVTSAAKAWLDYMKANPSLTEDLLWDMDEKRAKAAARKERENNKNLSNKDNKDEEEDSPELKSDGKEVKPEDKETDGEE